MKVTTASICIQLDVKQAALFAPELLINRSDTLAVFKAEKEGELGWLIPAGTTHVAILAKTQSNRSMVTLFAATDFRDGPYTLAVNKADKSLVLSRADGTGAPSPLPL